MVRGKSSIDFYKGLPFKRKFCFEILKVLLNHLNQIKMHPSEIRIAANLKVKMFSE